MKKLSAILLLGVLALSGCSEPVSAYSVNGVYQFDDFGDSCTQNCLITVEIQEDHISVIMSDNFGTYPMWYGTVDSVKSNGSITSKRTGDPSEIEELEDSLCGLNDPYRSFSYADNVIDFDIQPGGKDFHVSAERI